MKKLNNLDKIVIEIIIEDFDKGIIPLNKITKVLSQYEEQHFDTSK